MTGDHLATRVRVSLGALWIAALVAAASGSALAAPFGPPPSADARVLASAEAPRPAASAAPQPKDRKTRPSDLLSPMGRLAQQAQAALAKKQGRHFDSLDRDFCTDQQECEEESSDPDSGGPAGGQAETSLAVDSTGQHVVVGFNDTRGFALNPTSVSGFMYSDDGGATFTDGGQLPTPGNELVGAVRFPQVFGDPEVKYLGGSSFIYISILVRKLGAAGTAQTMGFHRSTDYGHTWTGPFEITSATNPHALTTGAASSARDVA